MEQSAPVPGYEWKFERSDSGITVQAATEAGEPAAHGKLSFRSVTPTEHRASFEAAVELAHQRHGLGHALIAWAEAATRDHYAANLAAGEPVAFRAEADTPAARAVALYRRSGLELTVAEDEMERPLTAIPNRDLAPELCVLSWGPMTAPLFFHAYDSAFRERPGFPGWDETRWQAAFAESDEFAPDLSMVVMDGPEPAAFAILWIEGVAGWITQMGVRPGWRGRGLGEALLARAMRSFADRGLQKAALEVATNNLVAHALYQRLGFETTHSWQAWQKQL